MPPDIFHLSDRCVVRVSGEDAENFLQNVITNDIRHAAKGKLVYACLLMPQGFYLHDFFIAKEDDGFLLDCEAARVDDLLRRFVIFKLRAKVNFEKAGGNLYAGEGLEDPRLPTLPRRRYTSQSREALPVSGYHDICIDQGVPCGSLAIRPERDTMADVNLDLLNAVAWDKGCFIGQEVAARMHNKQIAKRRLYIGTGENLKPGDKLGEVGEVRQTSTDNKKALVQVKLANISAAPAGILLNPPQYIKT